MFFVSNLQSSSQAGRRRFESGLPLHLFNDLGGLWWTVGASYLSEGEGEVPNILIPWDFAGLNASRPR
jgi:hypothetical protein